MVCWTWGCRFLVHVRARVSVLWLVVNGAGISCAEPSRSSVSSAASDPSLFPPLLSPGSRRLGHCFLVRPTPPSEPSVTPLLRRQSPPFPFSVAVPLWFPLISFSPFVLLFLGTLCAITHSLLSPNLLLTCICLPISKLLPHDLSWCC